MTFSLPKIDSSWLNKISSEFSKDYFLELIRFLELEHEQHEIYPPSDKLFAAFNHTPFNQVKVVILGQDPYHGEEQAHGLAFSVPEGVKPPPSLINVFKELNTDVNRPIDKKGNLNNWAKQGVLLLNATLTVRAKTPGSHQNKGWEQFTDRIIQCLSKENNHLVFMLWGSYAQKKGAVIDASKHLILQAPHPSPFSAHKGFFGCKHFSKCNNYLLEKRKVKIEW